MQGSGGVQLQHCTAFLRYTKAVSVVGSGFRQHALPRLLQERPAYMHAWVRLDNIQPIRAIEIDTYRTGGLEGAAQKHPKVPHYS